MIPPNETYAQRVLRDGAVAYYRLGEASGDILDSSGNAQTGTASGTPTYAVAGALGDGNTAITFDGVDDVYIIGPSLKMRPSLLSVEFFINPVAVQIVALSNLFGNVTDDGSGNIGFRVLMNNADPFTITLDVATAPNVFRSVTTGANVPSGSYTHVVVTYDGQFSKAYTNGTLRNTTDSGSVLPIVHPGSPTTRLGSNSVGGTQWYKGTLDEVSMYSTVLSLSQILEHLIQKNTAAYVGSQSSARSIQSNSGSQAALRQRFERSLKDKESKKWPKKQEDKGRTKWS